MDTADRKREDAEHFPRFETLGEAEVRYLIEFNSLHGPARAAAMRWLKARDQEERSRIEASSAEQMRLTREANQIAKQARNAAIAALIVATIGAIAAIVALL